MDKMDYMDKKIGILHKKVEALGRYDLQVWFQTLGNKRTRKTCLEWNPFQQDNGGGPTNTIII